MCRRYDHPPNKGAIAKRLALTTLHAAYAQQWDELHFEGPNLASVTAAAPGTAGVAGTAGTIIVALKPVGANHTVPVVRLADVLHCTTCCAKSSNTFETSADGGATWVGVAPADISTRTAGAVTLSGAGAAAATHVRYAWKDFVNCVVQVRRTRTATRVGR